MPTCVRSCAGVQSCGMDEISNRALPEGLELVRDERGRALVCGEMELRGDFTRLLPRMRADRLAHELLVRAARVRGVEHPAAVDATAGLGEDAVLLAAAGCTVTLIERDPVIAALLADALERAKEHPQLAPVIARMTLVEGDAVEVLPTLDFVPDVVVLDPMFPAKRTGAATKKKLQILQMLEKPCDDEAALIAAACAVRPRKVVVKRPLKGPALAGAKPASSLAGKVVRYDIIVP